MCDITGLSNAILWINRNIQMDYILNSAYMRLANDELTYVSSWRHIIEQFWTWLMRKFNFSACFACLAVICMNVQNMSQLYGL